MRVNASIGEPFVLSTYSTSHQLPKYTGSKKHRGFASVFATHEKASGNSDGYATVTAQADGIHVLDISTLHPVISYTLGPSTSFSCPAVMRNTQQGTESICTTYAAINTSADIIAEESGRTIWMWKENLSSRLVEDRATQKKKSAVIQHEISGLFACDEIPTRLLAQSPKGETTVLDTELNVKSTWPVAREGQQLLQTFVYCRASCSFLPSQSAPARGAILVTVTGSGDSTYVRTLSLDDVDHFLELGCSSIPVNLDDILDLSCSTSGHISLLIRDGSWHSCRLESKDNTSLELTTISDSFRLTGLSFISNSQRSEEISLISLNSSHVLLSALTASPNPEIVLLLWDLQYSVLLASQALPVPTTLAQAKDVTIKLTLVASSSSQVLLLLSPHTSNATRKAQPSTPRSSVLVVPLTCPAVSTIVNAMGRASAGAKWMHLAESSSSAAPTHDAPRTKVLATMRKAMEQNLPQAANAAFFEWEKRETKAAAKSSVEAVELSEKDTSTSNATLSYAFVKDLLMIVLQPLKSANSPYSSEIVRYLLKRRLVSSGMLDGGVAAALRAKNDWQSIALALTNVIDLSETEIVELLQLVVARHRLDAQVQDDAAMEVDSTSDLPSLPSFLALCVSYGTTSPALRSAMGVYFKEADDILVVLKVLENWLKQWTKRNVKLLPSKKDLSKNDHGVPVLKEKEKEIPQDLPVLPKVLAFLQTLLDASFLTLLQYPPAHSVLRSIHAQIEPEIVKIDDLEPLRGPLEIFVKAHSKTVKEAGQEKRKKPLADWRQRRKQTHEQAGLSIGLYQLEELVL